MPFLILLMLTTLSVFAQRPALTGLYRMACQAAASGQLVRADQDFGGMRVKVICHVGSAKPGCMGKERKFVNEDCIAGCTR